MKHFHTPLHIVKGLGPAHNGATMWATQRVVAAMRFFTVPFGAYLFCKIVTKSSAIKFDLSILDNTLELAMLWLFLVIEILHGSMECKMTIEDYASPRSLRNSLSVVMQILTVATLIALSAVLLTAIQRQ